MVPPEACRLCLSVDVRMYTIEDTPLQEIYEQITCTSLKNSDGKPVTACFICYHLLKKNQKFFKRTVQAEKWLQRILHSGVELTKTTINMINSVDLKLPLRATDCMYIEFHQHYEGSGDTSYNNEIKDEIIAEDVDNQPAFNDKDSESDLPLQIFSSEMTNSLQNYESFLENVFAGEKPNPLVIQTRALRKSEENILPDTEECGLINKVDKSKDMNENSRSNENNNQKNNDSSNLNVVNEKTDIENIENMEINDTTLNNDMINPHDLGFDDPMICDVCNVEFESRELLAEHVSSAHSVYDESNLVNCEIAVPVQCEKCGENFYCSNVLNLIQTGDYLCQNCVKESFPVQTDSVQKTYNCKVCQESFIHKNDLLDHKETHSDLKLYRCDVCFKTFNRDSSLYLHKKTHDSAKPFKCKLCLKSFVQKGNLESHIKVHNKDKLYQCNWCDKSFIQKGNLENHIKIHSGEHPYCCNICLKSFIQKGNYDKHMKKHIIPHDSELKAVAVEENSGLIRGNPRKSVAKQLKCDLCEEIFILKRDFNKHMLTHKVSNGTISGKRRKIDLAAVKTECKQVPVKNLQKNINCNYCDEVFTFKSELNNHMLSHKDVKPYKCDICSAAFYRLSYLRAHINIHSGIKPFFCEYCKKGFRNKSHLVSHIRSHLGLRPFKCEFCNTSYTRSDYLKKHLKSHKPTTDGTKKMIVEVDVKPFVCDICNKAFKLQTSLDIHKILHNTTHKSGKRYQCEQCGKSYTDKNCFKSHLRTHLDVKPFKCDNCEWAFREKSALSKHMLLHTGIKPFTCDVCPLAFSRKASLDIHKRKHTGDKPFLCAICSKGYISKSSLRNHEMTHLKRFSCNCCTKSYSSKFTLAKHIARKKRDVKRKAFSCDYCDKSYGHKITLDKHVKTKHGDERVISDRVLDGNVGEETVSEPMALSLTIRNK